MSDAHSEDLIAALDAAINGHVAWSLSWFRAALNGGGFPPEDLDDSPHMQDAFGQWLSGNSASPLLDQPAFESLRQLHREARETGRDLARRIESGQDVGAYEFETFADKVQQFHGAARRLEKAFGAAASELDTLTGLHNRFAMRRELIRERQRSIRSGNPSIIALADVDHFKSVNDTHGHAIGDRVLQKTAELLTANVRPFDHLFRYGGEEFLICLPSADHKQALSILNRIRTALESTEIDNGDGKTLKVTASFGAAEMNAEEELDATIEKADKALYAAKQGGRNRVVMG